MNYELNECILKCELNVELVHVESELNKTV